jgi:hypothetical protein
MSDLDAPSLSSKYTGVVCWRSCNLQPSAGGLGPKLEYKKAAFRGWDVEVCRKR